MIESGPILAANNWPTNADLIADCAKLGYLPAKGMVLDPTFGRGLWWTKWQPEHLVWHDLALDGVDFRNLPHCDNTFAGVAYDPPYVCVGGRKTTTIPDLHNRYGLTDAPKTPEALQRLINSGLTECARVLKPKGFLLVKCQDYVSSGRLWPGTYYTTSHGIGCGLELHDRLEHVSPHPRPQPPGRRQVHARRNLSTLLVFRKP